MPVEYARRADAPVISVVVPTVPGNDRGDTVAALLGQTFDGEYEVLFVVDEVLDRCEARNRGLRAATADVVALTDDDARPDPDWLATIHAAFSSDEELVCLEGPVYGGCRYRGTRHYVGCNLAVSRDAALAVGGFDSQYAQWREDTEFGWRLERDAAGRCAFEGALRVCHPTVPRTPLHVPTERRLRDEYPDRYADILDRTAADRLYRWARAAGITQPAHAVLNRVRRAITGGGPCRSSGTNS